MRGQRYLIGAAVVLGAVGIIGGTLIATKKDMYATSWTAIHPMEALDADGNITLCPGQTTADMDALSIGTSESPVAMITIGHALKKTWDFPTTAACYAGGTGCIAPGGTTPMRCGGRNSSDELFLTGSLYGAAIVHVHQDQSIGRTAYFGNSRTVPAKGLRAAMTSGPNGYIGECFTIEESGQRHFASAEDITTANCTKEASCTKYCAYSLDLL